MNFSAVILAGGKSSRMGRDKAFLEIDGQLLLTRQIQLVRAVGAAEVLISGRTGTDYSAFGCRVLQDQFLEAGPLAGIERALTQAACPLLLVLAVDLPEMNASCLRWLAGCTTDKTGAIPRVNGNLEPLAAFYPTTALPLALAQLNAQIYAVRRFAGCCAQSSLANLVDVAGDEARCFQNWNTPADFTSCRI